MNYSTEILSAGVEFFHPLFVKPLQLSSDEFREITEARAHVRVRLDGEETVGHGSIYLLDLWAWPDFSLSDGYADA